MGRFDKVVYHINHGYGLSAGDFTSRQLVRLAWAFSIKQLPICGEKTSKQFCELFRNMSIPLCNFYENINIHKIVAHRDTKG